MRTLSGRFYWLIHIGLFLQACGGSGAPPVSDAMGGDGVVLGDGAMIGFGDGGLQDKDGGGDRSVIGGGDGKVLVDGLGGPDGGASGDGVGLGLDGAVKDSGVPEPDYRFPTDGPVIPPDGQLGLDVGNAPKLQVLSVTPVNGASNVGATTQITVTFDAPIDVTTFGNTSLILKTNNVGVATTVQVNGAVVTATPKEPLPLGVRCYVTAMAGIRSTGGAYLVQNYSWNFLITKGQLGAATQFGEGAYPVLSLHPASGNALATWWASATAATVANGGNYVLATDKWTAQKPLHATAATTVVGGDRIAQFVRGNGVGLVGVSRATASGQDLSVYRYNPNSGLWYVSTSLTTAITTTMAAIGSDLAGVGTFVWGDSAGSGVTNKQIWAREHLYSGGTWNAAKKIWPASGTVAAWGVSNLDLKLDTNGDGFVHWLVQAASGGQRVLWACQRKADGGWQTPSAAESGVGQFAVDVDDHGNALRMWIKPGVLYAARYKASTQSWGVAKALHTATVSTPQVAMDNSSGNAVAMWVATENSQDYIYISRYSAFSDAWTAPAKLSGTKATAVGISNLKLIAGRYGQVFVAWVASKGSAVAAASRFSVATAMYHPGDDSWSFATAVADTSSCRDVNVGLDHNGRGMVFWWRNTGAATSAVYSARYK